MKWIIGTIIVLLAFILTLLDVAFFSNLPVYGATIVSTFIVAIIFALDSKWEKLIIFTSAAILFFSVFSSVSTLMVVFVFYAIPMAVTYLKRNYFNEPSAVLSIAYFAPAMLLFDLSLMLSTKQWGAGAILSVCYFVIINSVFGVIIYFPTLKIRSLFVIDRKIRV